MSKQRRKLTRKEIDERLVTCVECNRQVMLKDAAWARLSSGSGHVCPECVQKWMEGAAK